MRQLGGVGVVLAIAVLALGLGGGTTASATVLCKTAGNPCSSEMYATGTKIEASLKSGSNLVLDTKIGDIACSGLATAGETTNTGGSTENVSGLITTLTFSGCSATVTTLKNGSFSISSGAGSSATLTMEGFEITVEAKGSHCIFAGTATFSLQGGEVASGEGSATISRTGGRSGATCGSTGRWATALTVTTPHKLFFEESRSPAALCSNSSNPCSKGTYGKGTAIEANLKAGTKWVLNAAFGEVHCTESSVKGEVTTAGEEGGVSTPISGSVTSLSFGECNCGVKVLQQGKFSVSPSSGGVGTLTLEGLETTTECLTFHCIWSSSALSATLNGGEMASISANASIPRTGGTSGTSCGSSGTWKAEYTVTAPEPLYVAEQDASSTVLCKTATNPCTGGTYGKGTTVEASLPSGVKSVLDPPFGGIECSESSIKGEVTEGPKANVSGSLSSYSLGKCNAEVKVLRSGTFSIVSPKEGNATIRLNGFETTVEFLGTHCIFATANTNFGLLTGGEMATVDIVSTFPRVGGRSGAFCGSTAAWTGKYTITAPAPLYVEES
jgi:hypothetical protein